MESVVNNLGDETPDTRENDTKFNFETSKRSKNEKTSHDIETKESDLGGENANVNNVNNYQITPGKGNGFSIKNIKTAPENFQPRGNIVRDAIMKVPPIYIEHDKSLKNDPDDIQAVEKNNKATSPVENQNYAGQSGSVTSEVVSSSNPLILEDILSSTEENEEEAEETFPERVKIAKLPTRVNNIVEQEVKKINKRALPKNAETYQLETFEKSAMIIFNQENIDGYVKPREGTKEDVDTLKKTFSPFGFEINVHKDLRKDQIFDELKRFSTQDFTDHGCIAVVILTHGSDMGSLKAKDIRFSETDVINYFRTSVNDNQTLVTKPILIIIQACRGSKISKKKLVGQAGTVRKDEDIEEIQPYSLPIESDMLVLHSTYRGQASYRNDVCGSWFIQTLCEKITELSPSQDLVSIMTAVQRAVAIDMEYSWWNNRKNKYEVIKQMPVITSTLIRKLFLRRYEGGILNSNTRYFGSHVDRSSLEVMLTEGCRIVSLASAASGEEKEDDFENNAGAAHLRVVVFQSDHLEMDEIRACTLRRELESLSFARFAKKMEDKGMELWMPLFKMYPRLAGGGLKIYCEDELSLEWLKSQVKQLKGLWEGCPGFYLTQEYTRGIIWVNDFKEGDARVLKNYLAAMNRRDYDLDRWSLVYSEIQKAGSTQKITLVVGIPPADLIKLKDRGCRLFFKLATTPVHLSGYENNQAMSTVLEGDRRALDRASNYFHYSDVEVSISRSVAGASRLSK